MVYEHVDPSRYPLLAQTCQQVSSDIQPLIHARCMLRVKACKASTNYASWVSGQWTISAASVLFPLEVLKLLRL